MYYLNYNIDQIYKLLNESKNWIVYYKKERRKYNNKDPFIKMMVLWLKENYEYNSWIIYINWLKVQGKQCYNMRRSL
jgi:hypothetical protein